MNKNDFVKLIKLNDKYIKHNLYINAPGIVQDIQKDEIIVLFFNEYNWGDYALLSVDIQDIMVEKSQPPAEVLDYIKTNIIGINKKEKGFKPILFKEYDNVEMIAEKYTAQNVPKSAKGVVVSSYAVKDEILVDFGSLDKNKDYHGDCIVVNVNDIKKI